MLARGRHNILLLFGSVAAIVLVLVLCCDNISLVSCQTQRSSSSGYDQGSSREEILANRARRKKQIEAQLVDVKNRLSDHFSGAKILSDEDKKHLDKMKNIYERKLNSMEGEMDEREIESVLHRERVRHNRRERLRLQRAGEL